LLAGAAILDALVGKAHAVSACELSGGFQGGTGHWRTSILGCPLQDVSELIGPTPVGKIRLAPVSACFADLPDRYADLPDWSRSAEP
jgi:hypothetical protein